MRRHYRRICVDVETFKADYGAGKSVGTIARQAGVSISVVRERLLEAGVVFRDSWRPSRSPSAEVLKKLYLVEKLSTRCMATKLGTNSTTIRGWLLKAGIAMRSISEAKQGQGPTPNVVRASITARRKHFIPGKDMVGYKVDSYGYVHVWNDEKKRYEREHRKVMEAKLGRKLQRREDVHHINGDRKDNRPENLELFDSRADHQRHHAPERKRVEGRFA